MDATLVEYGVEIPAQAMVHPDEPTELILDPGHPGENDREYIERRKELFARCRQARLAGQAPPYIEYTAEEHAIWASVCPKLHDLHERYASEIYLKAKHTLGIREDHIPQLADLSQQTIRFTGMGLKPAEGPIPYRTFYQMIGDGFFPVTQFLRHGSQPEFTPEPDMIHDCLGHVPPLIDPDYAILLRKIGAAVNRASRGEHVLALKRFSWFSIEFGLIQEGTETKVFGAGILSSMGEIPFSLSAEVKRQPFVTDIVIRTDYDPSRMQDHLFVIESFAQLRAEAEALINHFGLGES